MGGVRARQPVSTSGSERLPSGRRFSFPPCSCPIPNRAKKGDKDRGAYQEVATKYDPPGIEAKWKARWQEDPPEARHVGRPSADKYYVLEYFPYPSGSGLSVGHLRNYVAGDVVARYHRMRGFEVLHPMGWDAFGLPAEMRARTEGRHPAVTTKEYAKRYREQLELVSCSYDWGRELTSSDPDYYRWTQWIFLLLYRRGLVYRGMARQWWCPECATFLANEQVLQRAGREVCWRGHDHLENRAAAQWFLRITAYADRLLRGLDELDWPPGIIAMQRHWIGRREGLEIDFPVASGTRYATGETVAVFTTRADTIYGATAIVLSPEHPLVERIVDPHRRAEVDSYVARARRRSAVQRQADGGKPTGVDTGAVARHPLTGEPLPIWVADYVLTRYGTGAIMLVPAHDERDSALATVAGLPRKEVVVPDEGDAELDEPGRSGGNSVGCSPARGGTAARPPHTGQGRLVSSGPYTGLDSREALRAIEADLVERGSGRRSVQYRLRDWSISRQRFWGAPIPIIHCEKCGALPVPDTDLPVRLPQVDRVPAPATGPDGEPASPLAALESFISTECPHCGADARREADTMDGFACSSWYFLRFTSPQFENGPFDPEAAAPWMPVDLYIGGAEHAVMHLLYARFWNMVLFDAGLSPVEEPFRRLCNQGMILDATGKKMSKSRPDWVITPDSAVGDFGADAVRAYEMFIAPFDQDVAWSEDSIVGVARWLRRVWRICRDDRRPPIRAGVRPEALRRAAHLAIRDVTAATERLRFNVAVARLMELTNVLAEALADGPRQTGSGYVEDAFRESVDILLRLMAPITPHIAEELWCARGGDYSVHSQAWPELDPAAITEHEIEIAVQVDGVFRGRISAHAGDDESVLRAAALASTTVQRHLDERDVAEVVVVPGRLVNVVTKG